MGNTNIDNSTESRALALLGSGISASVVAASLGVTESRISQLLSEDEFAQKVANLRYENLQKHNQRDATYDSLEDKLLQKMEDALPLMHRPMEILKSISVINAAKRRGTSTPDAILEKQQVIQLQIPIQIINKFTVNPEGQVTKIISENSEQSLLTIQSGSLDALIKEKRNDAKLIAGAHTDN